MRVIARGTLNGFVSKRVVAKNKKAVQNRLDAWYAEVSKAQWKSSADLKKQFRSASIVSAERVVFNIKGNEYRLITAINYHYQIIFIKWLGTHEEYDKIQVKDVQFDENRYSDPAD